MFGKPLEFLAIGDITTDAFIRLQDASVHCAVNTEKCELCMRFGDKVPFEYVKVVKAVGNSANAAVSAARLGLKSALAADIGDDANGADCLAELKRQNVDARYIKKHAKMPTNYHFVLWYEDDRTILIKQTEYDYQLPKISSDPQWIYLSSLASNSEQYHNRIAQYITDHPKVKLAFQPGTFQMKLGITKLKEIYARTEVFIVNLEEAQRILNSESRDIKELLSELHAHGPKLVLITDGPKGAYMLDGDHYYFMPIYPDPKPPFERTGCGDAFASTFISYLIKGKTPLEAFHIAPINPMSVVQFVGAQEGLLTAEQVDWWLSRAPADYQPKEI